MEYRAGKCSQCGAEYQVPASFAHNVARCKKCGVGVVHLGAPARGAGTTESAASTPARPVVPEPVAARDVPPPAERAPVGHGAGRPEKQRQEVSPLARAASTPAPPRPSSDPREPSSQAGPAERAPTTEGARSPRAAIIGIGLLLAAAVATFWFFYLRDKGA